MFPVESFSTEEETNSFSAENVAVLRIGRKSLAGKRVEVGKREKACESQQSVIYPRVGQTAQGGFEFILNTNVLRQDIKVMNESVGRTSCEQLGETRLMKVGKKGETLDVDISSYVSRYI